MKIFHTLGTHNLIILNPVQGVKGTLGTD